MLVKSGKALGNKGSLPERHPALLAEAAVTSSSPVKGASAGRVDLHLGRELDLTSEAGRQLSEAASLRPLASIKRGQRLVRGRAGGLGTGRSRLLRSHLSSLQVAVIRILNNTKVVEVVTWRGVGTGALVAGVPGVAGLVACRTVAALCGVAGLGAPGLTRGAEVGVATAGDWPVKNTFKHITFMSSHFK